MENKRVVITGLGAVCSLGNTAQELWQGVSAGQVGIGPLTRFDAEGHSTKVASEVHDFQTAGYLERKEANRMDPFTQYAAVAALNAMEDAGLAGGGFDPARAAVVLGVGLGGIQTLEEMSQKLFIKNSTSVPPLSVPKFMGNSPAGQISMKLGITGPAFVVASACTSATDAIGRALRSIRAGISDMAITGGCEGLISPIAFAGFSNLQAVSTKFNDQPKRASRPFDRDRDGFVIGEGAGVLVLESAEHAIKRGARIYAELAGYGATCDAHHLTAPRPDGRGAKAAMRIALATAGLATTDIDYINAHGTSTPLNDPTETAAIKATFGDHAYRLKVSSSKSMVGHLLGGSGGVEGVVTALALHHQIFPPTANLENPDPACDLDYVPQQAQPGQIRAAISNSFGFGGHNGVVALKRWDAAAA
jgi:3-oxoacyl-[acyl-carrier-protein] synthase II